MTCNRPDQETRAIALAHAPANCFTRVIIAHADANFNEIYFFVNS